MMWGKPLVVPGRTGHASISILGDSRSRPMDEVQKAFLCPKSRIAVSPWHAYVGHR
jgi:hypothetical protein